MPGGKKRQKSGSILKIWNRKNEASGKHILAQLEKFQWADKYILVSNKCRILAWNYCPFFFKHLNLIFPLLFLNEFFQDILK